MCWDLPHAGEVINFLGGIVRAPKGTGSRSLRRPKSTISVLPKPRIHLLFEFRNSFAIWISREEAIFKNIALTLHKQQSSI